MTPPTRAQITAIITLPEYLVEYWNGSAWTAITATWVLDAATIVETGSSDNGVAFGTEVSASGTLTLDPQASTIAWDGTRVRVSFGFGGSDKVFAFTGIVTSRERQDDGALTWHCEGHAATIRDTAVYSPLFYRRPIATETTATSIEDPTNGGYRAGMVNYLFWAAGGRPAAQSASYPSAVFYYACDGALMAPEWSWVSGEDAFAELQRLARAAGGQIYQDTSGVLKYLHPLNFAGSGAYVFDMSTFESIRESSTRQEKVGQVRCSYTGRRLQAEQIVYEDKTPRLIEAGSSLAVALDMQQPIYDYVLAVGGASLPADAYVAALFDGSAVPLTTSITTNAATRLGITFTNTYGAPVIISRIAVRGRPIAPMEEGIATYGSGTPAKEIGGDTGVYVQSRGHAQRLCRMVYDFYSLPQATFTLSGCGYDPDRYVGESVGLTYSPWSYTALPCRITAIRPANTGATMEVDLVSTNGLPVVTSFFIVGSTYSSGDVRQVSY